MDSSPGRDPHPCQKWSFREAALRALFSSHTPDIWMLQELTPSIYRNLRRILPPHFACERDFGETCSDLPEEENIFWDRRVFRCIGHGRLVVGRHHEPGKGEYNVYLTWVRLQFRRSCLSTGDHFEAGGEYYNSPPPSPSYEKKTGLEGEELGG